MVETSAEARAAYEAGRNFGIEVAKGCSPIFRAVNFHIEDETFDTLLVRPISRAAWELRAHGWGADRVRLWTVAAVTAGMEYLADFMPP